MFEKLAHLLARRHAKLKYWHVLWHVGTFIGTLARKNEKLARFYHVHTQGTLTRKPRWHASTSPRKLRLDASKLSCITRWHGGTFGTRFSKPKK